MRDPFNPPYVPSVTTGGTGDGELKQQVHAFYNIPSLHIVVLNHFIELAARSNEKVT